MYYNTFYISFNVFNAFFCERQNLAGARACILAYSTSSEHNAVGTSLSFFVGTKLRDVTRDVVAIGICRDMQAKSSLFCSTWTF